LFLLFFFVSFFFLQIILIAEISNLLRLHILFLHICSPFSSIS
jgi:hypothetical protein